MEKRSCFSCNHFPMCFVVKDVESFTTKGFKANIDSDDAPGKLNDIYDTVGNCCLAYAIIGEPKPAIHFTEPPYVLPY